MIYMILEISCWIFRKKERKKTFFNFQFFQTVIFGYFGFLAKNPQKLQKLFRKRPKLSICLLSFTFHQKNPLFDVDLFSRTFDIESPTWIIIDWFVNVMFSGPFSRWNVTIENISKKKHPMVLGSKFGISTFQT